MIGLERLVLEQGGFRLEADCAFPEGAVSALIGPSGAGKSTLLAALAGFLDPAAGRILIGGRDMAGVPPADRPVSILFQDHNLFPHLTALQNVGLGLAPDLALNTAQRAEAAGALAAMGLGGFEDRRPAQLSGGQRQRVALARALLRRRPVLLLDEPFAGLGPGLRKEMLDLVAQVAADRGLSVLMVTHQPEDAARIAGLAAFVDGARVHPPVPTAALLADPPPALAAYLGL
jgi:thiamine transport system ATP-binding protein